MELGLRGRTALITGASKGIGLASAECLAAEGVNVILVSRTQADLETARARIAGRCNVGVQVYAYDLSDSGNVDRLAAAHPDIDILVNNAGAIPGGDLQAIDEARWREAWDLKVFGYINMTRRFYAQMRERRRGVIVNVLGAAGENPDFNYIAGSSGNASLMAFTRALGKGAPADGLRVVAVNPGPVETDRLVMLRKAEAKLKWGDENRWRELSASMPFGRPASPREIGNAVAFLASPASGYTTGTVLTIDGGG
jgi:NAD(P)-dependent dehydrogenase (short-subunit alcohol dehydrogenase family)